MGLYQNIFGCWNIFSLCCVKMLISKHFGTKSIEIFSAYLWIISKHLGLGHWNILSLCHLEVFQDIGIAKIFSAYMIWRPISKHFELGAEIFSAYMIWRPISKHLVWVLKYSQPISSESISKHLGLWNNSQSVSSGSISHSLASFADIWAENILGLCHLELYQNTWGWALK